MKTQLAWLDQVDVASPCQIPWSEMAGDERTRFCSHCRLNVYNLSEMSREEAETFLRAQEGRVCIRIHRRDDGTLLTRDCPVGLRAARQRFVRAATALASLLAALVTGTLFGSKMNRLKPDNYEPPSQALAEWMEPGSTMQHFTAGVCILPRPSPGP